MSDPVAEFIREAADAQVRARAIASEWHEESMRKAVQSACLSIASLAILGSLYCIGTMTIPPAFQASAIILVLTLYFVAETDIGVRPEDR